MRTYLAMIRPWQRLEVSIIILIDEEIVAQNWLVVELALLLEHASRLPVKHSLSCTKLGKLKDNSRDELWAVL